MNTIAASRVRNIVYDTDFQTNVLDVAQTEGYAIPPFAVRVILNRLMKDMKNIGIYQLQDTLVNFVVGNPLYAQFSMIDWKFVGNIYAPYGGINHRPDGVQGNGVNAYIDTNYNPVQSGVNYAYGDAGRFAVVAREDNTDSGIIDGVSFVGSNNNSFNLTESVIQRINQGIRNIATTIDLTDTGFKSISRFDSEDVRFIDKNIEIERPVLRSVISDYSQVLLVRGMQSTTYSKIMISIYAMGSSVNFAMSQNFRDIYNQFLSRLNLEPIA